MEDEIVQIPEDDWVDQDLLTRELASDLLDEAIAAAEEPVSAGQGIEVLFSPEDLDRRLAAMKAVRDRHRDPSIKRVTGVEK